MTTFCMACAKMWRLSKVCSIVIRAQNSPDGIYVQVIIVHLMLSHIDLDHISHTRGTRNAHRFG